jgi:hypothetical protein
VYLLHPAATGWNEYLLHNFPAFTYDGQKGSVWPLAIDASARCTAPRHRAGATSVSI